MKLHYDFRWVQELGWAILIAIAAYLVQNLEGANWTSAATIWSSIGIGAARAALGALVAFAGHRKRHPGNDIPPGGSELPERFAHVSPTPPTRITPTGPARDEV